jgi:hypothetical protein
MALGGNTGTLDPRTGGAFASNPMNIAKEAIGGAREAGHFSAMGSPRLRALRRRRAMQLNAARRQAQGGAGQLYGLDPMQQKAALIRGDVAGNAALTSGLMGADFEEEQGQRQFLQGLYGQQLSYEQQRQLQKQQEKAAASGGIGQAVGAIGGAVINKYLPLARGGVVNGPMRAMIGEGGEPEAVVPQSHPGFRLMQRFGALPRRRFSGASDGGYGMSQGAARRSMGMYGG